MTIWNVPTVRRGDPLRASHINDLARAVSANRNMLNGFQTQAGLTDKPNAQDEDRSGPTYLKLESATSVGDNQWRYSASVQKYTTTLNAFSDFGTAFNVWVYNVYELSNTATYVGGSPVTILGTTAEYGSLVANIGSRIVFAWRTPWNENVSSDIRPVYHCDVPNPVIDAACT